MMKAIASFALMMGMVSAAELPQFSATDDYDELNLNIRLLQSNATSNDTSNATAAAFITKFSATGTFTTPAKTVKALAADTLFAETCGIACKELLESLTCTGKELLEYLMD